MILCSDTSPSHCYVFYQRSGEDEVVANIWENNQHVEDLPVQWDHLENLDTHIGRVTTAAEKVQWLVQNRHFSPSLQIDPQTHRCKIVFRVVPPEQKEWKTEKTLPIKGTISEITALSSDLLAIKGSDVVSLWNRERDGKLTEFPEQVAGNTQILRLSEEEVIVYTNNQLYKWKWRFEKPQLITINSDPNNNDNSVNANIPAKQEQNFVEESRRDSQVSKGKAEIKNTEASIDKIPENRSIADVKLFSNQELLVGYHSGLLVIYSTEEGNMKKLPILTNLNTEDETINLVTMEIVSSSAMVAIYATDSSSFLICWEKSNDHWNKKFTHDFHRSYDHRKFTIHPLTEKKFVVENNGEGWEGWVYAERMDRLDGSCVHFSLPQGFWLTDKKRTETKKSVFFYDLENSNRVKLQNVEGDSPFVGRLFNNQLLFAQENTISLHDRKNGSETCTMNMSKEASAEPLFLLPDDSFIVKFADEKTATLTIKKQKIHNTSSSLSDAFMHFPNHVLLPEGSIVLWTHRDGEDEPPSSAIQIMTPTQTDAYFTQKQKIEDTLSKDAFDIEDYKKFVKTCNRENRREEAYKTCVTAFSNLLQQENNKQAHKFLLCASRLQPNREERYLIYIYEAKDEKEKRNATEELINFYKSKGNTVKVEEWSKKFQADPSSRKKSTSTTVTKTSRQKRRREEDPNNNSRGMEDKNNDNN